MKKVLILLAVCFFAISSVSAQDQAGLFSVAGNLSYGTKVNSLGVGLRAQYGFTDRLRGSFEYKYYIDRHNLSAWGFNGDVHYVFGASDAVSLYPIGGVSVSRWTDDPSRSNVEGNKESKNRVGLNLGFGGQIAVGEKTFLQIEAKEALIAGAPQFVATVGFMYQF